MLKWYHRISLFLSVSIACLFAYVFLNEHSHRSSAAHDGSGPDPSAILFYYLGLLGLIICANSFLSSGLYFYKTKAKDGVVSLMFNFLMCAIFVNSVI